MIPQAPWQTRRESLECCLGKKRWRDGGGEGPSLLLVDVRGGEGHGSGGFCLASPETISRAGRFVLTAKAPPEGFQSEKRWCSVPDL